MPATTRAALAAIAALTASAAATAQTAWTQRTEYCAAAGNCPGTAPIRTLWRQPWQPMMALTSDGGVVGVASIDGVTFDLAGSVVVKRDTRTGRERWRHTNAGAAWDTADYRAVAAFANGDVVVTGYPNLAVRLDGVTGQVLWSVPVPAGAAEPASAVSVDAAGNLAVLVHAPPPSGSANLLVIKLAGSDGHELWRSTQPATSWSAAEQGRIVSLANGDVAVSSYASPAAGTINPYLVRLRGSDGTQAWRVTFDSVDPGATPYDLATTSTGDIVAAGRFAPDNAAWAARVRGSDGLILWRRTYPAFSLARNLFVDPDGSIGLGGPGSDTAGWNYARVSGADGIAQWTRTLPLGPTRIEQTSLARAPDGTLVATGHCIDTVRTCVVGVDPATGADRWSHVVAGASGIADAGSDVGFDARGNLVVNTYTSASSGTGATTAAQMRIVGPWADDLFVDGFD